MFITDVAWGMVPHLRLSDSDDIIIDVDEKHSFNFGVEDWSGVAEVGI